MHRGFGAWDPEPDLRWTLVAGKDYDPRRNARSKSSSRIDII